MGLIWPGGSAKPVDYFGLLMQLLGQTSADEFFIAELKTGRYYISPAVSRRMGLEPSGTGDIQDFLRQAVLQADRWAVQHTLDLMMKGLCRRQKVECRLLQKNGDVMRVGLRLACVVDEEGAPTIVVGSVHRLDEDGCADAATGLLTGRQFRAALEERLRDGRTGCLLLFGLDDLAQLNARHGRAFGDELLQLFGAAVKAQLVPGCMAYHLEGDCFAVDLAEKNQTAAMRFYDTVRREFVQRLCSLREDVFCTVSAGVVDYPQGDSDVETLLAYMGYALDCAKKEGKNKALPFSQSRYSQYLTAISTREDLQWCVANGMRGFTVYYQPQVEVPTGRLLGAEALMRWDSPELGRIPPGYFVPLLEEYGLARTAGRWILEEAVAQCAKWRQLVPDFCISVNVSYQQLERDDVAEYTMELLQRYGLPGRAVVLELTESARMKDLSGHNEALKYLKRTGVMVAVDDFGTGYSSLEYLKRLHIDQVKIDRTFVSRIQESEYDRLLIHFVAELAHNVGIKVCIEGVEQPEELHALMPMMPDSLQGYLFGMPVPAEMFEESCINAWAAKRELVQQAAQSMDAMPVSKTLFDVITEAELERVMDEMEEIVIISDLKTDALLHLNRAGREFMGHGAGQGYEGLYCYSLMKRSAPCEDCQKHTLHNDRFTTWEYEADAFGGEKVQMRSKRIVWKGRVARMGVIQTAGRALAANQAAARQLKMEKTMVACVAAMAEMNDIRKAVEPALAEIGRFYSADRVYVFELDDKGEVAQNTYEWCAPGTQPEMERYQNYNLKQGTPLWMQSLKKRDAIVAQTPEAMRRQYPDEYEQLMREGVQGQMIVPLLSGSRLMGIVGVDNPRYAAEDPSLLKSLAYFITNGIEKRRMTMELHRLSYVDVLTGAYNRNRYIHDSKAITATPWHSFGVVFVDINGLKEVNDREGHMAGDALICRVASALAACFEGYDVYRVGGDEFVVLCPGIEQSGLDTLLQRLENSAKEGGFTASVGHAWASGHFDIDELASQADKHMYDNKNSYYGSDPQNRDARRHKNS